MKIALYMHGGSGNHGCEALARTISSMCASIGETTLYSRRPEEDYQYIGKDKIKVEKCGVTLPKHTFAGIVSRIKSKVFKDNFAYVKPSYAPLLKDADSEMVAVSIGGDNYCYDGVPNVLAILNKELNKCAAKTILFGCSIEPSLLKDKNIVKDLSRYTLISARESITGNALKEANVDTEIIFAPDPAFTLNAKYLPLPPEFDENNAVGINISPMVLQYEEGKQVLYGAYCKLIEYIIRETNMQIVLIPHVVWKSTNDLEPINELWKRYSDSGRVIKIDDHDAEDDCLGLADALPRGAGAGVEVVVDIQSQHLSGVVGVAAGEGQVLVEELNGIGEGEEGADGDRGHDIGSLDLE